MEPTGGGAWLAAAGAGVEGELDVLLPLAGGVGVRSGLAMLPGSVVMALEPTGGGAWLAAAGAGDEGEPDVLLPFAGGVGLRSGLAMLPDSTVMALEPAGGGAWLAAAGAGDAGEPEVFDCAKAKPALPAMTKAVREAVRTREAIMGAFEVAALGSV